MCFDGKNESWVESLKKLVSVGCGKVKLEVFQFLKLKMPVEVFTVLN